MSENLLDYLHRMVASFDLNEEERAYIVKYIESINSNTKSLYTFLESDKNKQAFVKTLEDKFGAGKKDV
tara:strand:+ start:4913 stop:5119 length:207 start_codon:yes stop_codon:yes gene_type:complete